ncbi:MAG: hypothetical protein ACD_60C00046G0008 [uncultured bacterium]|nr:MAG: hypothetical protein ACD_60C00046G0008 [uncultured bacterium]
MQKNNIKKWLFNSFWLSILLHLLLLFTFSTIIIFQSEKQKEPPAYYVPAYVYSGGSASIPKPIMQKKSVMTAKENEKDISSSRTGILPKSLLAASFETVQQDQRQAALHALKNTEPVYLIGDTSQEADPLIKLLGKALSAHFDYPRMAGEFGTGGKVLVGMTLHPEGYFSDVQILKSSNNQDLDAAALYAVNAAPKVVGANRFLSQPKHFVVGFIFR